MLRRVRLDSADWGALWDQEYMPRVGDIDARGVGDACMGYYFSTGEDGLVDLLMGKPARPGAEPAEGIVVREVPAARYAVFECGLRDIAITWRTIYGEWLPQSGLTENVSAPCYEEFGPGCVTGAEPVRIYVPVESAVA